jgi:glucosamine-6-phosphate deaminase
MCLPSGTTPAKIYAEMSRSVRAGLVSFERASVFVLDEFGGVAPHDPGSSRNMLQRQLIDGIDLPPAAFHFLNPDEPEIERHCREYEAAIANGLDLTLLGIGLNGHLGMNEPDSPIDSVTRRIELHGTTIESSARYFAHQNLPRWGVTVGLKAILESREVWVLANGPGKAAILQRTVQGEIGLSNPASLLRRHANCSLFMDADAGALLDRQHSA